MSFELRDVWKSGSKGGLKNSAILAGATIALPAGRRIALLGPEREKNSAVLRILSGVDDPDKGVVRRVGSACWPFDFSGYVENAATLQQNANFIANVYGVDPEEVARIAAMLSGVKIVRGKPLKQYMPIERRAIQVGITLALQFDWYFIDQRLPEASASTSDLVHAALSDRLSRASVVWATNDPESVGDYCDAGIVLDQGLLTFYNDLGSAIDAYRSIGNEATTPDERRSRHSNRRRRAARRARKNDPEKLG